MDIKETIEIMSEGLYHTNNPVSAEAIKVSLEALEKQQAKKPKEEEFFDIMRRTNVKRVVCPQCDNYLTMVEFENDRARIYEEYKCIKHCIECGQKLDWN